MLLLQMQEYAMTKLKENSDTTTENLEVDGADLLSQIKRKIGEGNVRHIRITEPDGDIVLDIPLTVGAIAGGALVLAAPALALIGVIAGMVSKVRLEITKEEQKKA
jgi:uncharacterized membrane protein YoaK (UPF0700 family)